MDSHGQNATGRQLDLVERTAKRANDILSSARSHGKVSFAGVNGGQKPAIGSNVLPMTRAAPHVILRYPERSGIQGAESPDVDRRSKADQRSERSGGVL